MGGYGDKVPLRSALLAMQRTFGTYIHCCYNATYSMLMLTKQDSLLIIISRLRGSLIISRLSSRTKACFDWIDDSGSKQSESSIMLWPRQTQFLNLYAMSIGHPQQNWDSCWPQIWSGSSAASSEKLDTRDASRWLYDVTLAPNHLPQYSEMDIFYLAI